MSATQYATAGEQLVGRELAKETRQGVEHYVPGQHLAVIYPWSEDFFTKEPRQIARLTYVDQAGHACVILCCRTNTRDWYPTWASRAGQTFAEDARQVPDTLVLSEKALDALAYAREIPWPPDLEPRP